MKDRSIPSILAGGDINFWQTRRRQEIRDFFEHEVYGSMPVAGFRTSFSMVSSQEILDGLADKRELTACISVGDRQFSFPFLLLIPRHRQGRIPANIMIYGNENNAAPPWASDINIYDNFTNSYWPAKLLVECGIAAAIFNPANVESDNHDSFPSGLVTFFNDNLATPYSAGCIAAWAFATSRIVDYLISCPEIDTSCISITGHSRYGKTVLWCSAIDERISCTFANNSGCAGASMSRLSRGEKIGQITSAFPHWFSSNFAHYSGKESSMNFDQHMLLALTAPRKLYITSASEDSWNDPEAEFASCYYASEVYSAYGLAGLISTSDRLPALREVLHEGNIGYHLRAGGHDLSAFDWMQFLNFWARHSGPNSSR